MFRRGECSVASFVPSIDLKETDTEFVMSVEIPGFSKENLDITVAESSVTLKGERRGEREKRGESYHSRERCEGAFVRVIPLTGEVAVDKVTTQLKDGVLTVILPKAEMPKRTARKVKID